MLCDYGCGEEAYFITKTNKNCCCESYKRCPGLVKKNREGIAKARSEGRKGYTYNPNSSWNKGKANADFTYGGLGNHKQVLITERGHRCEKCGNSDWLGVPITLELEHVDGDTKNNAKDNLQLLCPNCHSQTPTWRRRKTSGKGPRYTESEMVEAIVTSENMNQALNKLGLKWCSSSTLMRVKDRLDLKFKT